MEIKYGTMDELVDGVIDSGVSVRDFVLTLLGRFGCGVTKGVSNRLDAYDIEREEARERVQSWEDRYRLDSISDWLRECVCANSGLSFYDAADKVVQYTFKSSEIRKCFAYTGRTIEFNQRGYIFLIGQFKRRAWLTENEYDRWIDETGLIEKVNKRSLT